MEIKELGFETICDIYPLEEPQPYEGDVLKHQEHDQASHGNWSTLTNTTFGDYKMTFEYQPSNELPLHFIHAYDQNKKQVGQLRWDSYTGTVNSISVEPEHQRKGIATAMWDWATKLSKTPAKDFPENIKHGWGIKNPRHDSFIVTPQGKSWIESLQKHEGGGHDQSTHGSWAEGSSESGLDAMPYEWKPDLGVDDSRLPPYKSKELSEALRNIAEAPIAIRLSAPELDSIIQEGRFKSLNEIPVEESPGQSQPYRDARSKLENGIWGVPKTGIQPIYGYMDTRYDGHEPQSEGYGDIKIILKDNVAGRTTFSAGDSLNSSLTPVKVTDARAGSLSNSALIAAHQSRSPESAGYQDIFRSPSRITYYEAQIHGGVSLKDIKSVDIRTQTGYSPPLSESTIKTLEQMGIEVIRD